MGDINARKTLLLGKEIGDRFSPATQLRRKLDEKVPEPSGLKRRRRSLTRFVTPEKLGTTHRQGTFDEE